jgi:hypothetical protein
MTKGKMEAGKAVTWTRNEYWIEARDPPEVCKGATTDAHINTERACVQTEAQK